jgi:hypothetical protein
VVSAKCWVERKFAQVGGAGVPAHLSQKRDTGPQSKVLLAVRQMQVDTQKLVLECGENILAVKSVELL